MTTPELISYIKKQLRKNTPRGLIISRLVYAGWKRVDIDEAFIQIDKPAPVENNFYREEISKPSPNQENNNFYNSKIKTDNEEEPVIKKEEIIREIEKNKKTEQENPKKEMDLYRESVAINEEKETSNKIIEENIIQENKEEKKEEKVDIKEEEFIPKLIPKDNVFSVEDKTKEEAPVAPNIRPIDDDFLKSKLQNINLPKEENYSNNYKEEQQSLDENTSPGISKERNFDGISKKAMISSYSKDVLEANSNQLKIESEAEVFSDPKQSSISDSTPPPVPDSVFTPSSVAIENNMSPENKRESIFSKKTEDKKGIPVEKSKPKPKRKIKWKIIFIIILFFLLGFGYFVFKNNDKINIKIPSIFKKGPERILMSNIQNINKLDSYIKESNLVLDFPSNLRMDFLSSDSLIVNPINLTVRSTGNFSQVSPSLVSFDNMVTIESPILSEKLIINSKSNGPNFFIHKDLIDKLIEFREIEEDFISIPENKIMLLISSLMDVQKIKNLDLNKTFSRGLISQVNQNILSNPRDIIGKSKIIQKRTDQLKGVDVYNYEFLIEEDFSGKIFKDIIPMAKLNSLEFWMGKNKDLYQIKITFEIKARDLIENTDGEDLIKASLTTTYYNFNVDTNIKSPEKSIDIDSFMKNIEDIKIKNKISQFRNIADDFYKVSNNYGTKSNNEGDCISPIDGSIFSSSGHKETLSLTSGKVKEVIDEILVLSDGNAYCYSTPGTWAISASLESNKDSFWCLDNNGDLKVLDKPITNSVCR